MTKKENITEENDFFSDKNEVKTPWVQWGKEKDWVRGTLIEIKEKESRLPGKEGEMTNVYVIKAIGGSFHGIDENKKVNEEPTILQPGEFWNVGERPTTKDTIKRIKIGQIVGFKYIEDVPSKTRGFNATKIIKVYAGEMDPEYAGEHPDDIEL